MAIRRARPKRNNAGGRGGASVARRLHDRVFRALIEHSADAICLLDAAGTLRYASPSTERILGYPPAALRRSSVFAFVHPEDQQRIRQEFARMLQQPGASLSVTVRCRHRDGSWRWIESTGTNRLADPDIRAVVINYRDVTARRQAEQELVLRSRVLDSMVEGVSISDEQGLILYTNPAEDAIFGYQRGELIGQHVSVQNTYPPEENARIVQEVIAQLKAQGAWQGEFSNRKKDGTPFTTFARITALEIDGRHYWVCVQEDITERKRAEAEAAWARAQLEAVFERITEAVVAFDREWRYTYVNTQATHLLQHPREHLLGRLLWEVFPEARHSPDFPLLRQTMEQQIALVFETYSQELGLWTEVHAYPAPEGITLFIRDISAHKQIERVAQRALERTARLQRVTAALVGALTVAQIGTVVLREGLAAVGGDAGSIALLTPTGDELELLHTVGYPAEIVEPFRRTSAQQPSPQADTVREGAPIFLENRAAALARWPYLAEVHPLIPWHAWANLPLFVGERAVGNLGLAFLEQQSFDAEVRGFLLTLAQQCSQALERARLYEAEQQARAHAEQVQRRMTFLADVTSQLTVSLEYATRLQQIARLVVPTLADWCIVYVQQPDGWITRMAVAHTDPQQEQRLQELQAQDRIDPGGPNPVAQVFRSGQPLIEARLAPEQLAPRLQGPLQQQIGQQLQPHSYLIFPLTVREQVLGAMSFVLADPGRIYRDEDMRLAREVARRAAVALDNARLYRDAQDAIQLRDQFLSVAAHELKTPLTSLLGNAQLLQRRDLRDGLLGPRERRNMAIIVDQAHRLSRMVATLLDVSRMEAGQLTIEHEPLELCALVGRIVEESTASLENRHLELDCPARPLWIVGDALRLEQVFQNLIQNAAKYSPPEAPIAVEVVPRGTAVAVAVRDQGIGIPSEDRPRLFQRFFRASNVNGSSVVGLGIGLYVVREIVALHGGSVTVESTEGQGSTFTVTLPLAPAPAA